MPPRKRKQEAVQSSTLDRFLKKRRTATAPGPPPRSNRKPGLLLRNLRGARQGMRYEGGLWAGLAAGKAPAMVVDLALEEVCDAWSIAFDRLQHLALTGGQAEGKKGVLRVLDTNPENDTCWDQVFGAQLEHHISACQWNDANEAQCFVGYAHRKEVSCFDLEECDEENMKPVSELKGSEQGVACLQQVGTTILGGSIGGRVHIWDARAGAEVGVLAHSGAYEAKGSVGMFGTRRRGGEPATYDGSKLAAKVPFPVTALSVAGQVVYAGYSDGRVSGFDMRCLGRGVLHTSSVRATLRDASGDEIYGMRAPPQEQKARVMDMLPSPFRDGAVICLMQSGGVVELDVGQGVAVRVYVPPTPSPGGDEEEAQEEPPPTAKMCYVPALSSLALPAPYGAAVIPWSADRFGKWTKEDEVDGVVSRTTFDTLARNGCASPGVAHPVINLPFQPYAVAHAAISGEIICSAPSGLHRSHCVGPRQAA